MEDSSFQWTCEVCQKVIKHKKSVSRHKKLHYSDRKNDFNCLKCLRKFDRKENLVRHQKKCLLKKGKKDITCILCLKQFKSQWYLNRHLETHKNKKSSVCSNCGQRLKNVEEADQHTILCKVNKPITSSELDEEFISMVPIGR